MALFPPSCRDIWGEKRQQSYSGPEGEESAHMRECQSACVLAEQALAGHQREGISQLRPCPRWFRAKKLQVRTRAESTRRKFISWTKTSKEEAISLDFHSQFGFPFIYLFFLAVLYFDFSSSDFNSTFNYPVFAVSECTAGQIYPYGLCWLLGGRRLSGNKTLND